MVEETPQINPVDPDPGRPRRRLLERDGVSVADERRREPTIVRAGRECLPKRQPRRPGRTRPRPSPTPRHGEADRDRCGGNRRRHRLTAPTTARSSSRASPGRCRTRRPRIAPASRPTRTSAGTRTSPRSTPAATASRPGCTSSPTTTARRSTTGSRPSSSGSRQEKERRTAALEADLKISMASTGRRSTARSSASKPRSSVYRADVDAYFGRLEGDATPSSSPSTPPGARPSRTSRKSAAAPTPRPTRTGDGREAGDGPQRNGHDRRRWSERSGRGGGDRGRRRGR